MADLFTLAEYKTLKNKSSTTEDSVISAIIPYVSQFIKEYCGRTLIDYYSTDKTEYFDGTLYDEVYLSEWPIVSITSVKTSTDGGVTWTTLTVNDDYFVDMQNDSILTKNGTSFVSSNIKHKSLEVVYNGGFEDTPGDIKLAAMNLLEYFKEEEYTPRKAIAGNMIENIAFRDVSPSALPAHIKRVLDLYRVV